MPEGSRFVPPEGRNTGWNTEGRDGQEGTRPGCKTVFCLVGTVLKQARKHATGGGKAGTSLSVGQQNVSLVQCLLVAKGICPVFGPGYRKVVRTTEVLFRTHVDIRVVVVV